MTRYPLSKLLEVLFVRELVSRTSQPPVITLINPGFCKTELSRDAKGFQAWRFAVMLAILARSSEAGSRTLLVGAAAGPESHGKYMSDCRNAPVAEWIDTPDGMKVQQTVYRQTMAVLEQIQPGIDRNV